MGPASDGPGVTLALSHPSSEAFSLESHYTLGMIIPHTGVATLIPFQVPVSPYSFSLSELLCSHSVNACVFVDGS